LQRVQTDPEIKATYVDPWSTCLRKERQCSIAMQELQREVVKEREHVDNARVMIQSLMVQKRNGDAEQWKKMMHKHRWLAMGAENELEEKRKIYAGLIEKTKQRWHALKTGVGTSILPEEKTKCVPWMRIGHPPITENEDQWRKRWEQHVRKVHEMKGSIQSFRRELPSPENLAHFYLPLNEGIRDEQITKNFSHLAAALEICTLHDYAEGVEVPHVDDMTKECYTAAFFWHLLDRIEPNEWSLQDSFIRLSLLDFKLLFERRSLRSLRDKCDDCCRNKATPLLQFDGKLQGSNDSHDDDAPLTGIPPLCIEENRRVTLRERYLKYKGKLLYGVLEAARLPMVLIP